MTLSDEINFGCLSWIIKVIWLIRQKVLQTAPASLPYFYKLNKKKEKKKKKRKKKS